MKSFFFILFFVILFFAYSCKENNESKLNLIAENVISNVNTLNDNGELPIIAPIDYNDFIGKILDNIKNNKIIAYDLDLNTEISYDIILKNFGAELDTVEIENSNTKKVEQMIIKGEIINNEASEFVFTENWLFDSLSLNFKKEINNISFYKRLYDIKDTAKNNLIKQFLFSIKCNKFNNVDLKNTISKNAEYNVFFADMKSKLNINEIVNTIIDKAINQNITVYDYFNFTPTIQKIEDIKSLFGVGEQKVMVENVSTGISEEKIITKTIDLSEITGLIFIERWDFDFENNIFNKIIIGYGPIREYYRNIDDVQKVKTVPFIIRLDLPKKES